MAAKITGLTAETFKFFRELSRNNNTAWMETNRERYRAQIVQPLRDLLEQLSPAVTKLDSEILITGRSGDNFSRINRDIRFARDKTPYKTHMYILFRSPQSRENGGATVGMKDYFEGKESGLAQFGIPRGKQHGPWLEKQKKRLARKYDSYWYSSEKNSWTKHEGWPTKPEEWKKLKAWIVRRKFPKGSATRPNFATEAAKIFREIHPLYQFTSSPKWKP